MEYFLPKGWLSSHHTHSQKVLPTPLKY